MPNLRELFTRYKNKRIAIYGLSTETEKAIAELDDFLDIVGLLDGFREEGEIYGKRIISLTEALERNVELILVVARPGSCKAIAKRIGAICKECQIDLFDVRGKDLCDIKKVTYDFKNIDGISKEQMRQLVNESDVVSIDLFDTLIMRQVLFPTDVFELVDYRIREKGIIIEEFCKKRLESEKYLAQFGAPTLIDIYTYMFEKYAIREISPEALAELEWSIDYELVLPRQELCDFLAEVYNMGKNIYIVSDTYYSKSQLTDLLKKCNISAYTDIFASCEFKTGKTGQLFEILKDKIEGKSCLHIGDDIVADIENAEKHGINTCRIYSGLELLEHAGYLGLWDSIDELANRIKVGMFVAKIFNSPFQFETEERRISVKNAYDIGYLFFAPMISDFVLWYAEQIRKYELKNIWSCARDGYLIQKMYDELHEDTPSVYFLTSRTAAIRAGVESIEDIEYVSEMKFSGTIEEQLAERFGIYNQSNADAYGKTKESLLDYSSEILDRALKCRDNYKIYIDGLDVKEGDIAFFDFVAKGTSQMYVERLVKNHLKGLYFLRLEEEHMRQKGLDIISFYTQGEKDSSAIFDNYYILETILTSPMPSVKEFDEQGNPCYAEETRKKEDIICFQETQEGIFDYFKTYLRICPKESMKIDKKIDELFLVLIHGISILDDNFRRLEVEDPFFNRKTDVVDLI